MANRNLAKASFIIHWSRATHDDIERTRAFLLGFPIVKSLLLSWAYVVSKCFPQARVKTKKNQMRNSNWLAKIRIIYWCKQKTFKNISYFTVSHYTNWQSLSTEVITDTVLLYLAVRCREELIVGKGDCTVNGLMEVYEVSRWRAASTAISYASLCAARSLGSFSKRSSRWSNPIGGNSSFSARIRVSRAYLCSRLWWRNTRRNTKSWTSIVSHFTPANKLRFRHILLFLKDAVICWLVYQIQIQLRFLKRISTSQTYFLSVGANWFLSVGTTSIVITGCRVVSERFTWEIEDLVHPSSIVFYA